MSITVAGRVLEFDAGHRVYGHEGKCAHLHGHRYKVDVSVSRSPMSGGLDEIGRVVDFSVIKQMVGQWIDHNWDHGLLLNSEDPIVKILKDQAPIEHKVFIFDKQNPTAEVIAKYLYELSETLLADFDIQIVSVTVWETPNCYARYPQSHS